MRQISTLHLLILAATATVIAIAGQPYAALAATSVITALAGALGVRVGAPRMEDPPDPPD